ncbi:MAG: hypothetical protein B7Z37_18745 [Verrucomicrobia bacterium 12-59-8]|nr:MAG: hypothetical protein B7Z37_18745 [Verrucomicrobia bacterium 12-59-8]
MNYAVSTVFDIWAKERTDDLWNGNLWAQAGEHSWPKWATYTVSPAIHLTDQVKESALMADFPMDLTPRSPWLVREELEEVFAPMLAKYQKRFEGLGVMVSLKPDMRPECVANEFFFPIRKEALNAVRHAEDALVGVISTVVNRRWESSKISDEQLRKQLFQRHRQSSLRLLGSQRLAGTIAQSQAQIEALREIYSKAA